MVDLASAIGVLVPAATASPVPAPGCYCLALVGGVQTITYWDAALPTQPTADQLAAVTPEQVATAKKAATIAAAGVALQTAADPVSVANRANASAVYTRINDVAEGLYATLQCAMAAANVAMPTAAQVQAQVQANRAALAAAGTPVDAGATDPATVAATCGVRLLQATILELIGGALAAGGGLPTG